jgi:hypothetical protein
MATACATNPARRASSEPARRRADNHS